MFNPKLLFRMRYIYLLISLLFFFSCTKDIEPVIADFEFVEKEKGLVIFTNKSTGADSYEWDFGNGRTSTEINPTFQFDTNKEYIVNLTAKGQGGQNTKPRSIKITTIPAPVVISFEYTEKENGIIVFSNKSTGADSYEWNFGNGKTSTETNPTFQFEENKEYSVKLTGKGAGGINTESKNIRVTKVIEPSDILAGSNYSGSLNYSCCNYSYVNHRKGVFKFVKVDKNTLSGELVQYGAYFNGVYIDNVVSDIFKFTKIKAESTSKFIINETNISLDGKNERKCIGAIVIEGNKLIINFEADYYFHKYELVLTKN